MAAKSSDGRGNPSNWNLRPLHEYPIVIQQKMHVADPLYARKESVVIALRRKVPVDELAILARRIPEKELKSFEDERGRTVDELAQDIYGHSFGYLLLRGDPTFSSSTWK